jgi:hypothetical protein
MFGTTDMKNFSFEGSLERDGHKEPFVASIEAPKPSAEEADEYTCVVHAPALLGKDREIYGVDPDQARQLAIEFLKSMLAGMALHDKAGKKIDIEAWR